MMLWTGFLLGIMGSLHCVGMCGPIALALPVPPGSSRTGGILLYNAGRILTYGSIGMLFGGIGYVAVLSGFQQYLSIVCGAVVILLALASLKGFSPERYLGKLTIVYLNFKNIFSKLFKKRSLSSLFFIGLLNGLLPCGMVYIALVGAVASGNFSDGGLYMVFFGLGTAPAMMLVTYINTLQNTWREKIRSVLPVFSVVVGVLLILRGLSLDIPYISPGISGGKVECCTTKQCH